MELKLVQAAVSEQLFVVLIAPLWNWNVGTGAPPFWVVGSNRTFMELKFAHVAIERFLNARSNRTFMELKYLWKDPLDESEWF